MATLRATELERCERTKMRARPVFVQGIMQKTLHELVAPCDALVNGLPLRLPPGTVVCLTAGGSGGNMGKLMSDVEFVGRNGETYRATKDMDLLIPAV